MRGCWGEKGDAASESSPTGGGGPRSGGEGQDISRAAARSRYRGFHRSDPLGQPFGLPPLPGGEDLKTHLPSTLNRARTLRRKISLPEVLLWRELKGRPGGLKFRKQHPFGRFVADFYCDAAKLVIEVDGIAHDMGDQPAFDSRRDDWFAAQGIRTLRIPARDILSDIDGVLALILAVADAAGPPPSVLRTATSPCGGGFSLEL